MAPHSSTLAWKIPWTEEPFRLQPMGSLRVGHDSVTSLSLFTSMHWRRKWQPTPVFLPGESQERGSLVGCHLWGRTESDTTEATQQQQQQQGHILLTSLVILIMIVMLTLITWLGYCFPGFLIAYTLPTPTPTFPIVFLGVRRQYCLLEEQEFILLFHESCILLNVFAILLQGRFVSHPPFIY